MPHPSATRISLIERVCRDDSRAWQELVELYGPLVAYWCRKLGVREVDITDRVQDVFLAVLRSLANYGQDGAEATSFRAWLWGVTRHKCIDGLRREGKHPQPPGGSTAFQAMGQWAEVVDPADSDAAEIGRLLRRAMQQVEAEFEPKTWLAFYRCTVDGISTAVVAKELDLDTATVRQYRSRVLRRLRRQLGELA